MGIKRLYSYLKNVFQDGHLKRFKNKTVGIDANNWLYQAYFGHHGSQNEEKIVIVRKIESRVKMLQKYKIKVG